MIPEFSRVCERRWIRTIVEFLWEFVSLRQVKVGMESLDKFRKAAERLVPVHLTTSSCPPSCLFIVQSKMYSDIMLVHPPNTTTGGQMALTTQIVTLQFRDLTMSYFILQFIILPRFISIQFYQASKTVGTVVLWWCLYCGYMNFMIVIYSVFDDSRHTVQFSPLVS